MHRALYNYVLVPFVLIWQASIASANDPSNASAGLRIAESECSSCHAIGISGDSPVLAAPPFRNFRSKWPNTPLSEAIIEGVSVGHGEMPEFMFDPNEMMSLIAYVVSIQK
jgi:cytochrome c